MSYQLDYYYKNRDKVLKRQKEKRDEDPDKFKKRVVQLRYNPLVY